MEPLPLNIPRYPMLRWEVRHGGWLAAVVAAALALASLWWGAQIGSAMLIVGGLLTAVVSFIVLRTLVELVRLITDMLLPK